MQGDTRSQLMQLCLPAAARVGKRNRGALFVDVSMGQRFPRFSLVPWPLGASVGGWPLRREVQDVLLQSIGIGGGSQAPSNVPDGGPDSLQFQQRTSTICALL